MHTHSQKHRQTEPAVPFSCGIFLSRERARGSVEAPPLSLSLSLSLFARPPSCRQTEQLQPKMQTAVAQRRERHQALSPPPTTAKMPWVYGLVYPCALEGKKRTGRTHPTARPSEEDAPESYRRSLHHARIGSSRCVVRFMIQFEFRLASTPPPPARIWVHLLAP